MPGTVLGNRTAAEFQLSIRASEHFGVLGAMEYDYCAGLPRLPVLQSMGLQKSEYLFELTIGISSSRTLAFHRVVLGHLGSSAWFGFLRLSMVPDQQGEIRNRPQDRLDATTRSLEPRDYLWFRLLGQLLCGQGSACGYLPDGCQ